MRVIDKTLIAKATRVLKLKKKDILKSREGPGWVVIVTVSGRKYLYYREDSVFPQADYQKAIKARGG